MHLLILAKVNFASRKIISVLERKLRIGSNLNNSLNGNVEVKTRQKYLICRRRAGQWEGGRGARVGRGGNELTYQIII